MSDLSGYDYQTYNSAGWNQPYYRQAPPMPSYQPAMQGQTVVGGQMQVAQPVNGLIRVTGEEGAKAYALPPNSVMPLFDANEDILYIKTTDGAGFPTIIAYDYRRRAACQPQPAEYVTRSEFDQLKEMVFGGKQPFQPVPAV